MRWEALFGDLEAQLAGAESAELAGEVADRTRRELARVRLGDRGRASIGAAVTLHLRAAGALTGHISGVGPDWWLLAGPPEHLVPLAAIEWVEGLPAAAAEPDTVGAVESRLGLGHVLRALSRDRAAVSVLLTDGRGLTGTIDAVGADWIDVAEHDRDSPRRASNVRATRTVPFAALAAIRRA